ncbi:MAG TPA: hypothetical protein VKB18_10800 [Gemmatimonadota bacterium]|nr:hypothetical protein [Gemmatimonadota bacterium]
MTPKEFDIPDIPDIPGLDDDPPPGGKRKTGGGSGRSGRRGRPRRWPWLVAGIVLGIAGTIFLPDLVRPHLPAALRGSGTRVRGLVVEKGRDGDKLLLTVDTPDGALLATFRRRVPEIELLVARGDSVTLGVSAYRPFVEGPELLGVRKPGEGVAGAAAGPSGAQGGGAAVPGSTRTVPAGSTAAPGSTGAVPSGARDSLPASDSVRGTARDTGA